MDEQRRADEPTQPTQGGWLPPDGGEGARGEDAPTRIGQRPPAGEPPPGPQSPAPGSPGGPQSPQSPAQGPQSPQSPDQPRPPDQPPPPGPQSPGEPQSPGGAQSPGEPGRTEVPQQPPGQPPPAPGHPAPYGPPGQPPAGQQPPGGWATSYPAATAAQEEQNTPAVVGLVLGVAGLAIFFVGGFFAFPLLLSLGCSIAAIFVGRNGVRKVDRGETSRNRGLGQAGFITGIVGTVLSVLGIVGWILLFVFLGEFTASFEQLEQDLDTDSFNVVLLTVAATALRSLGA